jgi:hypothetical protein
MLNKTGPDVWGPHGWKFLHFVCLGYPLFPTPEDKKNYYIFFTSFGKVIPCPICADHFQENLKKHPIDDNVLSTKNKLIEWSINMHNEVNKKNKKKIYTFQEGYDMILDGSLPYKCGDIINSENFTKNNSPNNSKSNNLYNKNILIIVLLLIIILLIINSCRHKKLN